MIKKLGPYLLGPNGTPENGIYVGDARVLSEAIPDESVDFIFTDPVYQNYDDYLWLGKVASRVLCQGGDLLAFAAPYHLGNIIGELMKSLTFRWVLIEKKMTRGTMIWSYRLFNHYIPIVWFTKGKPRKMKTRLDFMWARQLRSNISHDWNKGIGKVLRWLDRFSLPDDVVLDPFCGWGSVPIACKMSERSFLAFEINPCTAKEARNKVLDSQPPLPHLNFEQQTLI
jgi:DNA modification methylase